MRILRIVLEQGKSSMHVLLEDEEGTRLNIRYKWEEKDSSDVPPPRWKDHVIYEFHNEMANRKRGLLF